MSAPQRKASMHEDVFAHEQELIFKTQARRNQLIGLWAAATMGRDNAEKYANDIMVADITDSDGVFTRLRSDFDAAGVTVLDRDIRERMVLMLTEAAQDMYRR